MFKFSKICERFVKTIFLVRLYNFYRKPPPGRMSSGTPATAGKTSSTAPFGRRRRHDHAGPEDIVVVSEEAKARVV